MIREFNNKLIITIIMLILSISMIGCSSKADSLSNTMNSNENHNEGSDIFNEEENTFSDKSSSNSNTETVKTENNVKYENSQKILLDSIIKLAEQGKIINSDFSVKSTTIQDIEKKLGKADTSDFVSEAKGVYFSFLKYNVVFGSNKGDQVFEARSFDDKLGELSLSTVKRVLGEPVYNSKYNNEEIIGYEAGKEFKILFVFKEYQDDGKDYKLDHYSVLYPAGTINNMAGDSGRQW